MQLKTLILFLLLAIPASVFAASERYTVTEIINGKSFKTASGDTVRMASLQVPNVPETEGKKRPGEPLGEEAKQTLAKLIQDKQVKLATGAEPRDRKNRIVAQVYLEDGTWVQEAMLKQGMGMVYAIFADAKPEDLAAMLKAEKQARLEKKGIWAHPHFQVLDQKDAACCLDQFRLVRGKVLDVEARRGNVYINFGRDYKTDFTVFIPKKSVKSFKDSEVEHLVGKTIEVRGWLSEQGGPMIEATRPEQITVP